MKKIYKNDDGKRNRRNERNKEKNRKINKRERRIRKMEKKIIQSRAEGQRRRRMK